MKLRRLVVGISAIGAVHAVSAIMLLALASQRWPYLSQYQTIEILLFIQWQAVGLMLCKCGYDQLTLSLVSITEGQNINYLATMVRAPLALVACFVFASTYKYPLIISIAIGFSIWVDSYSLMLNAKANADGRNDVAAVSALLNYPVFFSLLFALSTIKSANMGLVTILFVSSSLLRFAFLFFCKRKDMAGDGIVLSPGAMLLQQTANYWTFRGDQIVISAFPQIGFSESGHSWVAGYLFFSKIVELFSSAFVVIGAVLFPDRQVILHCRRFIEQSSYFFRLSIGLLTFGSIVGAIVCISSVFRGSLDYFLVLGFAAHVTLILPFNFCTFLALREKQVGLLIRCHVGGATVAGGWALGGLAIGLKPAIILAAIVPIQLGVAISLFYLFRIKPKLSG